MKPRSRWMRHDAAICLECKLLGGTFSDDRYGNTHCHCPGGTVQCDAILDG